MCYFYIILLNINSTLIHIEYKTYIYDTYIYFYIVFKFVFEKKNKKKYAQKDLCQVSHHTRLQAHTSPLDLFTTRQSASPSPSHVNLLFFIFLHAPSTSQTSRTTSSGAEPGISLRGGRT
jgi:hypothetical protein